MDFNQRETAMRRAREAFNALTAALNGARSYLSDDDNAKLMLGSLMMDTTLEDAIQRFDAEKTAYEKGLEAGRKGEVPSTPTSVLDAIRMPE